MELLRRLSGRLKLIITLLFCFFGGIAAYLFHLQIVNMNRFFKLSQNNFTRQEKIASPRGNITDRHGTLLATNRPFFTVYWQGTGKRSLTKHQELLLTKLSTILSLPADVTSTIKLHERRSGKLKLASDVPFEHLSRLLEQFPQEPNIFLEKTFKRCYPHKELACHIVGYLGLENDAPGKMGLELYCHKELKGHCGKILKIINSLGNHLHAHQVSPALAGKTLQTTLDSTLQKVAEDLFPAGYEGCCLLMDDTGALEVILSRPSFDPSLFLKPLSCEDWKKLQEKKGFINRAFNACYPPASLFKLVTLAAALETGLISKDMRWHCIGHTDFKGRFYHCSNKEGHGVLSTEQALAHSCNIPFFEIGKKIKIDTLAQYAGRFGLGLKTGVLFPEKVGLIPTNGWKKRVRKEPWWPGETLSATIGQSCLLVTPLQIACMINALCTGERVRPRMLIDEAIVKEQLDLSKDTLTFLQHCLSSVIKQGTGSHLKYLKDFKIQGKTGTAQVQALDKPSLTKESLCHGYFAAHFQYKQEPAKTLVVLIEHAGSSSVASRFALKFLKQYAAIRQNEK